MTRARPERHRLEHALVAALLALAAALRFWRLDLGWFGVDQARDIQTALDIAAGKDWPMVGPTMRRVTSLGAVYHYFWALPHLLSTDPLAAYYFAAGLGVATVGLTWSLARRLFGGRAALVALAVLATWPVAIIDGRVAWAPAALPGAAVVLLWLLVGRAPFATGDAGAAWWGAHGTRRLVLLGLALGLALQLHLSMVAWLATAAVVVLLHPPDRRSLAAGVASFGIAAAPAVYALLANAGRDAGLASLPARGPFPDVLGRLVAAAATGWRVPAAFWQWTGAPDPWARVACAAIMAITAVALLGAARLAAASMRGGRAARIVALAGGAQLGMVILLPGDAWYYYLDALLPLVALAAGAALAPAPAPSEPRGRRRAASLAAAGVIAISVGLAVHTASWLAAIARHGYLVLDPAPLALDGRGGRDAPRPGRLVTLGAKRAVAGAVAVEPAPFTMRWRATHGPAFDDATGDNGFWLMRASRPDDRPASVTHATLWYRDDPAAPTTASPDAELVGIGPFVVARGKPTILYDECRAGAEPVSVPVRVVPHPKDYGDGTSARAPTVPSPITCAVAAGEGGTRVVAAVTAGMVTVRAAAGTASSGRESTLCVARAAEPAPFTIEVALESGVAGDLDLYERPDPACAAGKIAP